MPSKIKMLDSIPENYNLEGEGNWKKKSNSTMGGKHEIERRQTFRKNGVSQMGLSSGSFNQDIGEDKLTNDYQLHGGDIMLREIAPGLTVRQAIDKVNECVDEKKKNPNAQIVIPGMFWNGCDYKKILEEEQERKRPKRFLPMQIKIQQQFLKAQQKAKKVE
jgi:hypothetical protein